MYKPWGFYRMCIGMPKSFGAIKCSKILDVLDRAGRGKDKLHHVRLPLAHTKLRVGFKAVYSPEFGTWIGCIQGDTFSPVLFTCQLACAVPPVIRAGAFHQAKPAYLNTGHASWDGVGLCRWCRLFGWGKISLWKSTSYSCRTTERCKRFHKWSKTEFTHGHLSNTQALGKNGTPSRGEERWRKSKIPAPWSALPLTRCIIRNIAFFLFFWDMDTWVHNFPGKMSAAVQCHPGYHSLLHDCSSWTTPKVTLENV